MKSQINTLRQLQELVLTRDEHHQTGDGSHLDALNDSIAELQKKLNPQVAGIYENLYKKNHVFISAMTNNCCAVCGMQVPIAHGQLVKMAQHLVTCSSCGRILFADDAVVNTSEAPDRDNPKTGISRFSAEDLMVPNLTASTKEEAIAQLAEQTNYFGMYAVHARIECRLLAHFAHMGIHLLLALLHHVLNAGRMNAAVLNKPLESHLRDLTAQRAVRGKNDGLRSVIDNEVHAGGRLKGAYITPFTADYAAFHVLARQGDGRHGLLAHIIAGIALDSTGKDFLRFAISRFLGFCLNKANHLGRFMPCSRLDILEKALSGLFHCKTRNFLETTLLLIPHGFDKILFFCKKLLPPGLIFLLLENLMLLAGDALHFFFHSVTDILELFLPGFQGAFLILVFQLHRLLLAKNLVLPLEKDLFFLGLSFFAGLFYNASCKTMGIFFALLCNMALNDAANRYPTQNSSKHKQTSDQGIHDVFLYMLTDKVPDG